MITAQDIENMPIGRVLKRWTTPKGSHQKMRVVKPFSLCACDICHKGILNKSVKTESGGSIAILVQCPDCAAKELNDEELMK